MNASECRKIASSPYVRVLTDIEDCARHGKYHFQERYRSQENLSEDIQKYLISEGFVIEIKEDEEWPTDGYGNYDDEGEVKTFYTVTIKW